MLHSMKLSEGNIAAADDNGSRNTNGQRSDKSASSRDSMILSSLLALQQNRINSTMTMLHTYTRVRLNWYYAQVNYTTT